MAGLSSTGTLKYNGVTFTGAYHVIASTETVYDDTGRTVAAHRVTLDVDTIVSAADHNADSTDDVMEGLRFRLGQAGGKLEFKNKGFGNDLVINKGDIDNGPKPRVLSWEPIGNHLAAHVKWQCVVTTPPCRYSRTVGVSQIVWGATWAIDRHGDTVRTLSGYIEIASRGIGNSTADQYRQFFAPLPLRGYTREQSWAISADKRRCEFTITDTQIPTHNVYPPGMTAIEATHRVAYKPFDTSGNRLVNSISATISPRADLTGSQAWQVFLDIAARRLKTSIEKGASPFMVGLDIEEDMFGRAQSFRLTYRLLKDGKVDFVGDTGIWVKAVTTSWDDWELSLVNSTFHPRGTSQLQDLQGDDKRNDLCVGQSPVTPNNWQFIATNRPLRPFKPLKNPTPSPGESYLDMKAAMEIVRDRPAVQQPALQDADNTQAGNSWEALTQDAPPVGNDYGGTYPSRIDDRIEVGGSSSYKVLLKGYAERAGHRIPRPYIKKVGGREATEVRGEFVEQEKGTHFGVKVYEAAWAIWYLVGGPPSAVKVAKKLND